MAALFAERMAASRDIAAYKKERGLPVLDEKQEERVLEKNAAYGVLSTFVGMTTDSRSLLSLARHDWFRRVLCRWVAAKVSSGGLPDDPALLAPMLENVCYLNAKRTFR